MKFYPQIFFSIRVRLLKIVSCHLEILTIVLPSVDLKFVTKFPSD